MAVKEWTPKQPRFEMVKVPLESSSGPTVRARVRSISGRASRARSRASDFPSASDSTGTSSAPSTATAMPMFTRE